MKNELLFVRRKCSHSSSNMRVLKPSATISSKTYILVQSISKNSGIVFRDARRVLFKSLLNEDLNKTSQIKFKENLSKLIRSPLQRI